MKQLLRFSISGVFLFTCNCIDSAPPPGRVRLIASFVLPSVLPEASGMIEYDNTLYLLNDGENGPGFTDLTPLPEL
jgi:hypothetical protein